MQGTPCQKSFTLPAALSALNDLHGSAASQDMPAHTHEHLEGTVGIIENGQLVRKWKTSLAGRYVPQLCRAWAALLRLHAPVGAIPAVKRPGLETCWQLWLMQATGEHGHSFVPTPSCPVSFSTGWENAVAVWDHSQKGGRKAGAAPGAEQDDEALAPGGASGSAAHPGAKASKATTKSQILKGKPAAQVRKRPAQAGG